MTLKVEHEIHQRRLGKNVGVGLLLAGFIGKAIPPKASGIPYVKER